MNDRRKEDRLYTAVLMAFLIGLVVIGLLGVPALLVAAIGAVLATVGIVLSRGFLAGPGGRRRGGERVPAKYVPSVLESSSGRRRRTLHPGRGRNASTPLRFR